MSARDTRSQPAFLLMRRREEGGGGGGGGGGEEEEEEEEMKTTVDRVISTHTPPPGAKAKDPGFNYSSQGARDW